MGKATWLVAAIIAVLIQGTLLVDSLRPGDHRRVDFFQDWSSAREALAGRSAYPNLTDVAARLLGDTGQHDSLAPRFNPHPPVSVLLCLPLARLDYDVALLIWRIGTLALS